MIYRKIDIKKIEERYEIYEDGKIFDKKRRKYCKKRLDSKGYHRVWIACEQRNVPVHRLVLCKFNPIKNEEEMQVNHINCIKTDNRLENLEWTAQSENQKHAFRNDLLSRKGEKNPQAKLTEREVIEIANKLVENKLTYAEIAKEYGISATLIYRIANHLTWTELTKDYEFPARPKRNCVRPQCFDFEDELIQDLKNNVDIDIISEKYHLSKRYIRDFKYRNLRTY